jgi:hypothetical protein
MRKRLHRPVPGKSASKLGARPSGVVVSDNLGHDLALPLGGSCLSYRIGHNIHRIQGITSAGANVVIRVSIVAHASGLVELHGRGLTLDCWTHAPPAIQESLMRCDPGDTWWKPEWHVLSFGAHVGRMFSLAGLEHQSPCVREEDLTPLPPTASALDRVRRGARELGGYTVRLESLQAAIAAEELTADRGRHRDEFGVDW